MLMCCGRKLKVSCDVCEEHDNSNIEQDKWKERAWKINKKREREREEEDKIILVLPAFKKKVN